MSKTNDYDIQDIYSIITENHETLLDLRVKKNNDDFSIDDQLDQSPILGYSLPLE